MNYLDEWNDEQRDVVAAWRRKNIALRSAIAQINVRASSTKGELGVSVDGHGKVIGLRLTPQAMRLGDARLGRILLDTIQRAQSDAARQVELTSKPYLDDPAAAESMKFIRSLLGDE